MPKGTPSANGRADRVRHLLTGVRSYLFDELNKSHHGDEERDAAYQLMIQVGQVDKALKGADDEEAYQIERDRLRSLVWEVRRFSLRSHQTLIRPLWKWPTVQVDPNAVCVLGGDEIAAVMAGCARARGLRVLEKTSGFGAAEARWKQIRECAVAVFDLRAPEAYASACHTLGYALTLGVYPVVVLSPGVKRPFDMDLPPVELTSGDEDATRFEEAIDEALFGLQPTAGDVSSVKETVAAVAELAKSSDATTQVLSRRMHDGDPLDPIRANDLMGQLLSIHGGGELAVVRATWPGAYPEPHVRRCFHVMPFSQPWSDGVRDTVRAVCDEEGVSYRRGDETAEQRIIRAIWDELCRATHVVVDLTGLNPNVCLELGLAQALGRPTLLLTRDTQTIEGLYPEVAKLQVRAYSAADLAKTVREFLQS